MKQSSARCALQWQQSTNTNARRNTAASHGVGGAYLLGEFAHFEAMHEGMRLGLDGLFACAIDKFCFGIAEAA